MKTNEEREAILRLISRLLDGDILSPEDRQQLNDTLLADREARRLYMLYIEMELEFACMVEPAVVSDESMTEAAKKIVPPEVVPALEVVPENVVDSSAWTRELKSKGRKRWPEFAFAAAAAVAIIFFAVNNIQRPASSPSIGLLEKATGEVQFGGAGSDDEDLEVAEGIEVKADQTLVTQGEESSAVFVFEDGTSIVVTGDTEISSVDGAKRVSVTAGAVAASVNPQPVDKPFIVSTPIADIEVVGTRFSVNHFGDLTDLAVTEGAVVLRRHSDGKSIRVTEGKRVFAEPGGLLRLENLPSLASRWLADFEGGQRHRHCHVGEVFSAHDGELPEGSTGGLRAARIEEKDRPGAFTEQAAFGTPWAEGLMMARENTHLHLRYKMENPGALQIQVETRTDGPKPQLERYQFNRFEATEPDQWIEASIPLRAFSNVADENDATMAGEIPHTLLVVAPIDGSGLVIDELSLNSRGSGEFESAPVE